jgi:hypothetical protein
MHFRVIRLFFEKSVKGPPAKVEIWLPVVP